MPPCEPVFQVIELGHDHGENLEILPMESTVLSMHYVIHINSFHMNLMRP